MLLFVLFSLVSGISLSNKEDQCYLVSTYLVRERMHEIDDHIKLYPHLKEPEVKMKIIEQGYLYCMDHITDDEVKSLLNSRKKEYSRYSHLTNANYGELRSIKETKLQPDFVSKRLEISKRLSFSSKESKDL